jgi:hypothetical protein
MLAKQHDLKKRECFFEIMAVFRIADSLNQHYKIDKVAAPLLAPVTCLI